MNGSRKIHNVSQGSPRSPNTSGLIEHPHTHRPKSNLFSLHDRGAVSRPSSLQRMKKMKAQKEKVVDYIVKYLKRTQEPKVAIDSEKQLALTRNLKEFLNYLEDKNIIQSGTTQLEDPAAVQSLIRDLMKLDLSKFYQVAPKKKDKKKGSRSKPPDPRREREPQPRHLQRQPREQEQAETLQAEVQRPGERCDLQQLHDQQQPGGQGHLLRPQHGPEPAFQQRQNQDGSQLEDELPKALRVLEA